VVLTIADCSALYFQIWEDFEATPAFIVTDFVANRLRSTRLWFLNYHTQSPVLFLRVIVLH
jgi:hypothetical protein